MKRAALRGRDAWPIGVAVLYVAYGVFLLAVGGLETIVTPDGGSTTVHDPSTVGLIPLVTGGLVLYGIWFGRERIVWAATALALISGVAFLFSLSGVLIPLAVLLVAGLALRRALGQRQPSRG